jgi:hypothetical protein
MLLIKLINQAAPSRSALPEFCAAERISRSRLYAWWKEGRGPRFYMNGKGRIITHAARPETQGFTEDRNEAARRRLPRGPRSFD